MAENTVIFTEVGHSFMVRCSNQQGKHGRLGKAKRIHFRRPIIVRASGRNNEKYKRTAEMAMMITMLIGRKSSLLSSLGAPFTTADKS
jgi:hypothetical protein